MPAAQPDHQAAMYEQPIMQAIPAAQPDHQAAMYEQPIMQAMPASQYDHQAATQAEPQALNVPQLDDHAFAQPVVACEP